MEWDVSSIEGPDGDDWRVPTSETNERQARLAAKLTEAGIESALIHDPVDMYWLTGSRQAGAVLIGGEESTTESAYFVRQSVDRALWETGESDAPLPVLAHPRANALRETLEERGVMGEVAMQLGRMPHSQGEFLRSKVGKGSDCTGLVWELRETKSDWEIEQMLASGEVNRWMFEAIYDEGGEGVSEIELAAAAESVSRAAGFGGNVMMRKWPMNCDRVVIAAGSSGSVPTYFDSAVGGTGPHPMAGLGAGFHRIKRGEPVLVDIVHTHRGYVSDCTRIFSVGPLDSEWEERLSTMEEARGAIVASLGSGENCSAAYEKGVDVAKQAGLDGHLMGMPPEQARFLGHSIGLELDETPVVAAGFDRPLHQGGTMAIEPKVIFPNGAVGPEDCWVRRDDGLQCLTAGDLIPLHQEW